MSHTDIELTFVAAAAARTPSSTQAVDFRWCQTGLEMMP
jgi:hypothetical protein